MGSQTCVRQQRPETAAYYLYDVIGGHPPGQPAAQRLDHGDGGIEVRAADRTQQCDQGREHRHRRAGVGQERDRQISTGSGVRP